MECTKLARRRATDEVYDAIRHAIQQLAAAGLVNIHPRRATNVVACRIRARSQPPSPGQPARLAQKRREHEEIVALEARDVFRLTEALRAHIVRAQVSLMGTLPEVAGE